MKTLLVDDHAMLRDGLKAILVNAGLSIVGESASGREAVRLAQCLHPELVVMDISMPDLNGIDATRQIRTTVPSAKVLALSMHSDRRYVASMLNAGAIGYILKQSASDELMQALEAISRGELFVSPAVAGIIVAEWAGGRRSEKRVECLLTPREREVLQLIAEGKSSKNIASCLDVALPTVETHRRQIMSKLNLRTIAELTKYAIREGLTSLEW